MIFRIAFGAIGAFLALLMIEVLEPAGEKRFLAVVGLGEARRTNDELRTELSSGINTSDQREMQSRITR